MSSPAVDSWLSWFKSRKSFDVVNKQHQESLFKNFDHTVKKKDCIEAMIQHNETVFIHRSCVGEKKVVLFHHLTKVGGSIYDTSSVKYGFIHGLGSTTAFPMIPDIEMLGEDSSDTPVTVPTLTQMFGIKSSDDIDNLTASSTRVKVRNFIPVPPFLVEVIHNAINEFDGNVKQIIFETTKAIKEFDEVHNDDDEYKEKAKSKCKDIVFWLYLVFANSSEIKPVQVSSCTNETLVSSLNDISQSCLSNAKNVSDIISSQVESSLKRPFEVLASSSASTIEFMERLTQLQSTASEKSSKSFNKLPAKYQQMILVASSVGEITLTEYDADAKEFFKSSNNLNAQILLNSKLETEGIEVSVSPAMTTALLVGSFLWKNPLSPSGFASSVLISEGVFRSDTLHEGMILDLSTKHEVSTEALSKLTKTQVKYPLDMEGLIHRVKGITSLSIYFFKKNSYLSQGLAHLVKFCEENRMLIKTRIHLEPKFIAKFLCALDERIYLWLRQCSMKTNVLDTDINLINFINLTTDIQLNRFNYVLPEAVMDVSKKRKGSESEVEKNHSINKDWKIRDNEPWDRFVNKANEGPTLSFGGKPCLKYHVKGICYSDCAHRKSHRELNKEDKRLMSDYLRQLRKD